MSDQILVSDREGAKLFGVSRTTFWRRVGDGTFPKPVKFGGAVRWRKDELEAVIDRASEARGAA